MHSKALYLHIASDCQGYEADESDDEWDEYIERKYGEIARSVVDDCNNDEDPYFHVEAVLHDTFDMWDTMRADVVAAEEARAQNNVTIGDQQGNSDDEDDVDEFLDAEGNMPWGDPDKFDASTHAEFERLNEAGRVPLFEGSTISRLTATILILNLLKTHGSSALLISEMFALLHRVILQQPNSLPDSGYEAHSHLKNLGIEYETIDVCPNNCVLFRGPYKDKQLCPNCDSMRRRLQGNSWVAEKVLRYFPITERLARMFRSPMQAAAMTWHDRPQIRDNLMRGPADSPQWRFINERYPDFAKDARNVRLAIAADGMNPFSEKRSVHSTWPVCLLNYNVAPWMTTKRYFILLAMIIPGKKSVTSDNFDVFLEPLVDELYKLWMDGVMCRDAGRWRNESHFIMRAMVIWTIHDLQAYGMMAGCTTKGFKGCPICGPYTISRRSRSLSKNVMDNQHRRMLPLDNDMRYDCEHFRGGVDHNPPPPLITGAEVIEWGAEREAFLKDGGTRNSPNDPVHRHGIKRVSVLFRLPYWKVCCK